MGAAWARHAMCVSRPLLSSQRKSKNKENSLNKPNSNGQLGVCIFFFLLSPVRIQPELNVNNQNTHTHTHTHTHTPAYVLSQFRSFNMQIN